MAPQPAEGTAGLSCVLVNDEDQYSIWPQRLAVPVGWRVVGEAGSREACLAFVEEIWRDMRPKSLRHAPTTEGSDSEP